MARECISCKLKLDYGSDTEGNSNGSWTFSKVIPDLEPKAYYNLASGLRMFQTYDDAEFLRIAEYRISR